MNRSPSTIPFLKWAGGKRWLTQSHAKLFPDHYDYYIEPFLGSGAVFFHLNPRKATLSDTNADLINAYLAIKNNYSLVYRYLREHQSAHSKEYYYRIRAETPTSTFRKAANFIYLNRTCWNGLYRVNLKGQFNVPIGTKNSVLLETDNFKETARRLSKCNLVNQDFRVSIRDAREGDFIFVDPPYTVKHNLNGFVKYNESIFSWDDQIALSEELVSASDRGVKFLMTNANHESIRSLYRGLFSISSLKRQSVIAASSEFRSPTSEIVITNY